MSNKTNTRFSYGILYLVCFALIIGLTQSAQAQQGFSLTSLYNQNLYNLNPAYAGYNGCFEASLQNKKQWLGTNGTPLNYLMQVHKSIGSSSGIGLNINHWKAGLIRNNNIGITYSKHFFIGDNGQLSLGLNGGLLMQQFAAGDAIYFDAGDAALVGGNSSAMGAVFDAGAIYRQGGFRIGVAVPKVFGTKLSYGGSAVTFDQERELRGHISYNAELSDNIGFEPMVVYRQLPGSSPVIDFYGRFGLGNSIGLGAGYRTNESLLASLDLTISDKYKFAYAFDYSSSRSTLTGASHEILLGVNLCKDKFPYSVDIQQSDSSYQQNPFKSMVEVGEYQKTVSDTNKSLGKRIQKELDENPGAMVYKIPLADPIILNLHHQQYRFETFEQMDDYFEGLKTDNPDMYDQIMDAYDDDNPIVLRSLRKEYKFRNLKDAHHFIDSLEIANPNLAAQVRSYTTDDNSLVLDVRDKKMRFETLQEMEEFVTKLKNSDPILAAKTQELIDANPDADNFEIEMGENVEKVHETVTENGDTIFEIKSVPLDQLYNYTINLIDSASNKNSNYFKNLVEVKEYEDAVRDTNEAIAVKIQGAISEKPKAHVWDVYINDPIVLRLHAQKYKFRTLKEMNEYILKMKTEDPDLALRLEAAMNDDTELIVNTKKEKFVFRTLKKMSDFSLKLEEENPVLSAEFNQAVEDNDALIVKVPGEKYKFKTLAAMKDYLLKLEKSNPGLAEKIRGLVNEDPSSLQYDVRLAQKINMKKDPVTGEISFSAEDIPDEDLQGYVINIIDTNEVKEYNFFKRFFLINDYMKGVQDTNVRLATRIKAEITENPKARQFDVNRFEEIVLRLHGQKYKFRTLKELDDYILSIETSDPDLAIRLKKALEDESELIINTSKKKFKFRSLKSMTDYAWSLKDSDPALAAEFDAAMEDGNLLVVNVKGQKFKFRTLKQMDQYLLKLEETNPSLAGKIKTLMDEEPTALIYELKLAKKIDLVMDEETGEMKFVVQEVPVEEIYKKHEKITNFKDLSQYTVYFKLNKYNVDLEGMAVANEVVKIMKEDPKLMIRVEGYSCALGDDKIKLSYSERRARSVRKYMILQGIKSKRIKMVGRGDVAPKASNSAEDTRKLNRRVEFKRAR